MQLQQFLHWPHIKHTEEDSLAPVLLMGLFTIVFTIALVYSYSATL